MSIKKISDEFNRRFASEMQPWKEYAMVTMWQQQYRQMRVRYGFLVLDGPSRMGKTQFARSLSQAPGGVLEINMAGAAKVDMRAYDALVHDLLLFDECEPGAVLENKKLFQAGGGPVSLQTSATNLHAFAVCVCVWLKNASSSVATTGRPNFSCCLGRTRSGSGRTRTISMSLSQCGRTRSRCGAAQSEGLTKSRARRRPRCSAEPGAGHDNLRALVFVGVLARWRAFGASVEMGGIRRGRWDVGGVLGALIVAWRSSCVGCVACEGGRGRGGRPRSGGTLR